MNKSDERLTKISTSIYERIINILAKIKSLGKWSIVDISISVTVRDDKFMQIYKYKFTDTVVNEKV